MGLVAYVISAADWCLCDVVDDYSGEKNVEKKNASTCRVQQFKASASLWSSRPEVYTL